MTETRKTKTPDFIVYGLYRERGYKEWRELGPIFLDGSKGGWGHLKSIPTSGWNYKFRLVPYGSPAPPLPPDRPEQPPAKPPPDGEEDIYSSDS
jgi:hypothetical protein